MSTLQRSAYSFRRQGSSGRIWDNRLQISDIKPIAPSHDNNSTEFNSNPVIGNTKAPDSNVRSLPRSRSETKNSAIGNTGKISNLQKFSALNYYSKKECNLFTSSQY
ncbi:hypothetical protein BUALT_Bualt04G0150900 [Buddleja alternifolia]|uniref:Uncharacterized protein n=1 Tax=Buddleja alternifolia TaxID=168488 RepID=A0AAV6Y0D5_9LAMI|nr:hypothetical protein BUALT_Bualt04G0150900 [Buddleja alternifolia]